VRVNVPGSPWCHEDVAALAAGARRPDTIVLPKVESAGDIAFAERLLAGCERAAGGGEGLGVRALIEAAAGVRRVAELAGARAGAVIESRGAGARGAVTVDGAMVDEAVRLAAERVLARAGVGA